VLEVPAQIKVGEAVAVIDGMPLKKLTFTVWVDVAEQELAPVTV
jgi:hypothetical protein